MEPLRSWEEIGARVARARQAAGLTQQELAQQVGLSRTAVVRLEAGDRQLDALELSRLASTTGRRVEWFVSAPPSRIASHRGAAPDRPDAVRLEDQLEQAARDTEMLIEIGELRDPPLALTPHAVAVDSYEAAEEAAGNVRQRLEITGGPLTNLAGAAERLGLLPFALDIGSDAVDAAYVRVSESWGVTVLNRTVQDGRRRFNLAHELGHHLLGDEYTAEFAAGSTRGDRERLIDAFVIHLLLPRTGVTEAWSVRLDEVGSPRPALICLAAEYGVSWSAACAQANRFDLIDNHDYAALVDRLPTRAEYLELGVEPYTELADLHVPGPFTQATLRAYRHHKIAGRRVVELLRGGITGDDLPDTDELPLDALRGDFDPLP